MNTRKCVTGIALRLLALCTALSAGTAYATSQTQWQINSEGTGIGNAIALAGVDVGGAGFVQIFPDATFSSFQFVEYGAYQLLKADKTSPLGNHDLSVSYEVQGTGSFSDLSALHFTSGKISLYSDPGFDFATATSHYGVDNGTRVAKFSVYDGGLSLATGLVTVKANLETGSLLPGYLFSANGNDLAHSFNTTMELGVFNQVTTPDSHLVSGIVCGLANYKGPGCNGTPFANSLLAYTVRDGGYATISAVPEPGVSSLLLAGLGLIALTKKRRHRQNR